MQALEAMEALSLNLLEDLTTLTTPLKLYAGELVLLLIVYALAALRLGF